MSNLKTSEKSLFEDLFGMGGGYVLENRLNNNSFAALFRSSVKLDIDSNRYKVNGSSKANRLRAFWELESDAIVGKALAELLELWKYDNSDDSKVSQGSKYSEAVNIVSRLCGKKVEEVDPEQAFLDRKYEDISISNLQLGDAVMPMLEERLIEAQKCFKSDAPLATIILCGSLLEGILLGIASQRPKDFNQAVQAPKDHEGNVRQFSDWTLADFINVAHGLELLKLDVKKFSHGLRDFRNYIHPYQQMASKFSPDKHTAEICLQVLKAAIASLGGTR